MLSFFTFCNHLLADNNVVDVLLLFNDSITVCLSNGVYHAGPSIAVSVMHQSDVCLSHFYRHHGIRR